MAHTSTKKYIQECSKLLQRLIYLEKQNARKCPSGGYSNEEEKAKLDKDLLSYANSNVRRNTKIKAYFILLILDLVSMMKGDPEVAKIADKMALIPELKRFKRSGVIPIKTLKELIYFYRDAICHPEETVGENSPRRSVKFNILDSHMFMFSSFDEMNSDVFFKMGDCTIRISHIKGFLKRIKKICHQ